MPSNVKISIGTDDPPKMGFFGRLAVFIFWCFVALMLVFFFMAWDENYRKLERDGITGDAGQWWQENGERVERERFER